MSLAEDQRSNNKLMKSSGSVKAGIKDPGRPGLVSKSWVINQNKFCYWRNSRIFSSHLGTRGKHLVSAVSKSSILFELLQLGREKEGASQGMIDPPTLWRCISAKKNPPPGARSLGHFSFMASVSTAAAQVTGVRWDEFRPDGQRSPEDGNSVAAFQEILAIHAVPRFFFFNQFLWLLEVNYEKPIGTQEMLENAALERY